MTATRPTRERPYSIGCLVVYIAVVLGWLVAGVWLMTHVYG